MQKFDSVTKDVVCHGLKKIIKEGYKSFPSGHTSCKSSKNIKVVKYKSIPVN